MIKHILLLLLPVLICRSQDLKTPINASDIEYDKNKITVYYSSDHTFNNATYDSELNFIPNIASETKSKKNFFEARTLRGQVKKVTVYSKKSTDSNLKFERSVVFDKDGYLLESENIINKTLYFYDQNRNVVKEITLANSDTTHLKFMKYNEKNQLVHLVSEKIGNKNYPYNLSVTIEYNNSGNPVTIKNDHPIEEYSYTTKIAYNGNIITETEISSDTIDVREYWYSQKNDILKYQHNLKWTVFSEYNENREVIKETTYTDNEFAWSNTYDYNSHGDIVMHRYSSNPEVNAEIYYNEIRYDNLNNIIFKKDTNSFSDKVHETIYEYQYYQ